MSPLKGILVCTRRRSSVTVYRGAAACVAFIITFTFACRAAVASTPPAAYEIRDADARKAEKVLAKLRLLYEAADAGDADAYRVLASKLYPDLFVKVAEIRACDLGTDLSTAVFLAEKLGRIRAAAWVATADCRGERPDIYMPLCLSLRGGTVRQLLLAKSRLHARWAGATLRDYRGEADAETARALSEMKAARANDRLIAARVVETLRPLEGLLGRSAADAGRAERLVTKAAGPDSSYDEFADALHAAGTLLASMPRSQTFYRLSGARQAYADGLSWYLKARQSKRLVISVNSFMPDPLKGLALDAGQAVSAATANWRSAAKLTRLTEQSLSEVARAQSGGSVRMSGGVSEFVMLSIPQGAGASGAGVHVNVSRNTDQSLTITLSGAARELAEVSIPIQIRSNTGYKLFAKAQAGGSDLSSLSVVNAHATGNLVDAAAVETLSVAPTFDARPGAGRLTPARGFNRPNLSALSELLSGPRVSLGGTLLSPHNALQVTLSLTIEPRGDDRVRTIEVLLSAAPS